MIDRLFFLWVALGLLIPFALGWAIGGTIGAAFAALLWAGFVRVLLLHHVTWSINSVCHFFGTRRFDVQDESTNVGWLAPFAFGEAWHHNHHAFPTSAFHGLRLGERMTDPTGLLILMLEKCGLVWNVVRISPERQAAKLKAAASGAAQAMRLQEGPSSARRPPGCPSRPRRPHGSRSRRSRSRSGGFWQRQTVTVSKGYTGDVSGQRLSDAVKRVVVVIENHNVP